MEKPHNRPQQELSIAGRKKNNREIFGGIVAYDQVWRLGANEATEIEFF